MIAQAQLGYLGDYHGAQLGGYGDYGDYHGVQFGDYGHYDRDEEAWLGENPLMECGFCGYACEDDNSFDTHMEKDHPG